jgi:dihydrolipoamide dehydrogenase
MVMGELAQETQVLVIGSGPGGYAAAFRAADLGLEVTMVDMERDRGRSFPAIPSDVALPPTYSRCSEIRVDHFGQPKIDLEKLAPGRTRSTNWPMGSSLSKRGVQL